jgi:LCP family protein required for cell wall assembly
LHPRHAACLPPTLARHRLRAQSGRRPLKIGATVVAATLLAGCVAVGERIRQLDSNMTVLERVEELVGSAGRPELQATTTAEPEPLDPFGGRAVNILITAIDSREGENATVVRDSLESPPLNDINMIAHISADRSRVDIVSIPRDTLVDMPSCTRPDGSMSYERSSAMINEAFQQASDDPADKAEGVACIMKTIEYVSGIRLDSFILVEFASFAKVVDALGGVDMCVPDGLIGDKTHIDLPPGINHLNGQGALQFARTRSGKTYAGEYLDGSDVVRISRQQQLIATVVAEVLSSGDLQSLPKLNATASAVTKSLAVGPELGSVMDMAGLAFALRGIKMENVSLFTIPWTQDQQDNNRVRLATWHDQSRFGGLNAEELFEVLARDEPVPGTAPYKVLHPDTGSDAVPSDEPSASGGAEGTLGGGEAGGQGGAGGADAPMPDDDFVSPVTAVSATCVPAGQGSDG